MSGFAGSCQDLGFLCDWQAADSSREGVVTALVDHLNAIHGTGATSPTLSRLIDRFVIDVPVSPDSTSTHA